MSKSVKALSVILILAALFGLVGSGLSLKDALDSKSYFEQKGVETDENLSTLEGGLAQLEENEQAYLDGREAYADGLKQYEEGKQTYEDGLKEYEAGKQALADAAVQIADGEAQLAANRPAYEAGKVQLAAAAKQLQDGRNELAAGEKQYNDGKQELAAAAQQLAAGEQSLAEGKQAYEAGQQQYEAGKQQLEQAKQLLAGLSQLQSGFATWQQGYNGLQQAAATLGLPDPAASNVETYDGAIDAAKAEVSKGLAACDQIDALNAQKAQLESDIAAAEEAGEDTSALTAQLQEVNGTIAAYQGALNGETRESLTQKQGLLNQLTGVPGVVAQGQQDLAAGLGQAMNGVLADEATANKLAEASGMSVDQIKQTVAALPSMDYPTFNATMQKFMGLAQSLGADVQQQITDGEAQLAAAEQQLAEGKAELDAGEAKLNEGKQAYAEGAQALAAAEKQLVAGRAALADGEAQYAAGAAKLKEFEAGEAKLAAGKKEFAEGQQKLADAEQQLADGKAQLDDAEKQLADGKAQLDQFEDGRDQIMAGLDTVLATEADNGLVSIADRLGPDYTYMKNDTDLDIEAGKDAAAAARAYSSDSGDLITKEVWTRVAGAAMALVGSLLALVAGALGLGSKFKPSSIMSDITAVLGAGGLGTLLAAGSHYSEQAGASAVTIVLVAAGVLAAAALANGIATLGASKKAAV